MASKRYTIEACRPQDDSTQDSSWSVWVETNDISKVWGYARDARKCGYKSRIRDSRITAFEQMKKAGRLLFPPVAIGETVYRVVKVGTEWKLEKWVVRYLTFDGKMWFVSDGLGNGYPYGSIDCLKSKAAYKKRRQLEGEWNE